MSEETSEKELGELLFRLERSFFYDKVDDVEIIAAYQAARAGDATARRLLQGIAGTDDNPPTKVILEGRAGMAGRALQMIALLHGQATEGEAG